MDEPTRKRDLRRKEPVSYEISDDSDNGNPNSGDSAFSTPHKRKLVYVEDEIEEVEPLKTPPPRQSSAGHSLRPHNDLHLSLRAQENGDKPVAKKRRSMPTPRRAPKRLPAQRNAFAQTARNEIRDIIATETTAKRARFFVAKKDYFLPLLPESNYVQRLVEQRAEKYPGVEEREVPYQPLSEQPQG